jgi:hypothetical protein
MKLHGLTANRRTAEYQIPNYEGRFRFAQSFLNRQNTSLRHSTFIIRYSLFQSFFFDLTGRFQASGGAEP